jgi:hypothetical protein
MVLEGGPLDISNNVITNVGDIFGNGAGLTNSPIYPGGTNVTVTQTPTGPVIQVTSAPGGSGTGSTVDQSPWTNKVDAADYALTNVADISFKNADITIEPEIEYTYDIPGKTLTLKAQDIMAEGDVVESVTAGKLILSGGNGEYNESMTLFDRNGGDVEVRGGRRAFRVGSVNGTASIIGEGIFLDYITGIPAITTRVAKADSIGFTVGALIITNGAPTNGAVWSATDLSGNGEWRRNQPFATGYTSCESNRNTWTISGLASKPRYVQAIMCKNGSMCSSTGWATPVQDNCVNINYAGTASPASYLGRLIVVGAFSVFLEVKTWNDDGVVMTFENSTATNTAQNNVYTYLLIHP